MIGGQWGADFARIPVHASPPAGEPLGHTVRAPLERAFGQSFDDVQIHTDAWAASSAGRMGARAYTVGSHIAFGPGEFAPGTIAGRMLIAHELAHIAQQRGSPEAQAPRIDRQHEREAGLASARAVLGERVASGAPVAIALADNEPDWTDALLDAVKSAARDTLKKSAGLTEGVALEAANIVDTVIWLPMPQPTPSTTLSPGSRIAKDSPRNNERRCAAWRTA